MEPISPIQYLTEIQQLSFYGWWQLAVCLFAFVALMAIWWHIGRRQRDFGQVWLALSVLCWSFSGGVEVYFSYQLEKKSKPLFVQIDRLANQDYKLSSDETKALQNQFSYPFKRDVSNYQLNGWRSVFSLFNSLFILLALPWFRYLPNRLEHIIKSKFWLYIVGLPFLFSLLPTVSRMLSGKSYGLISELDVYYSILTLGFLGYVLWESFAKRRLPILALLSTVCILITFIAQIYKLTGSAVNLTLFSAIFKTSLIMIFFALALSWVKELAEELRPRANQLFLAFNRIKAENGKFEHRVKLSGIAGVEPKFIPLSPALYQLLLKFAERKSTDGEDWLEIKPKNDGRSGKTYDIRDHNEIRRLLNALLDGLFGKGNWTKSQHEEPFKSALFEMSEKRERKIRLKLPAENILFHQ